MNQIDLSGRAAVVTGGGQGIGLAIARRLSTSGAKICLWDVDRPTADAAATEMDGAMAATVDVTDPDSVAAGVAETVAAFGKIDILVNNAGISPWHDRRRLWPHRQHRLRRRQGRQP
jgi:3-oxoacyl-[acyl-carrier protein] reductase